MQIKTSELTGAALDWAVAKCEGWVDDCNGWLYQATLKDVEEGSYKPSTDWSQGGPIIEREKIGIDHDVTVEHPDGWWTSSFVEPVDYDFIETNGPTPLIAAMRCYVESKLGDTVDIPEELV